MNIYYSLFFALTSIAVITATDVSAKRGSCSIFDSCDAKSQQRTCSCSEDCHVYGTCCHDSNKHTSKHSNSPFQCYHQRTITPVFAKRSCVENYAGHIRNIDACLDDDIDEMDVGNNILVTSRRTKITYWNSFCAVCNNEVKEDFELWSIEVFCPPREQVDRWLIRTNLTFDEDNKRWGLNLDGEFLQCVVKYASPPYIDEVKHCTPNLISSCPANYSKKKAINKCSQFYAERRLRNSDKYYKNAYCAICNGVDVKELECSGMRKPEDDVEETDFREMVEEVFINGEWLEKEKGQRYQCSKGYSYDPFWEKCRRIKRKVSAPIVMDPMLSSSQTLKLGLLSWLTVLLVLLH